ncbi:hypothetical protein [Streptomyces cyaneofuscatus]|uniref:hypothetical protein n=1 Tax=Streptomyces cyaneofuscatus TaxID=66883 RepID=UPI003332C390
MMSRVPGGERTEIQVEGAISAGLRRFPRGVADLRTIPARALHGLADDRIELRFPDTRSAGAGRDVTRGRGRWTA